LARRVRQSDRQLQIVFVSGYSDYLADGYEVEALHYLLKPVSAQKLDAVLDRALERLDARGRSLLVESDEGLCRLPL
ncbi:DNA-binding response regulator, partial [Klebsiella oxytoca]